MDNTNSTKRVAHQAYTNQTNNTGQQLEDDLRAETTSGKISLACVALNTFGSKKAKKVLPVDFQPNAHTVILGRGASSDSSGNRQLRILVQSYLQQYLDAPDKLGKSLIVSQVLDIVRENSPRAAFVKFEKGRWVDVGERTSREKVGSMFRDCLGDKYKSSAKTKTAIRAQKRKAKQQQEELTHQTEAQQGLLQLKRPPGW
ncbi:Nitrilase family, member 2 [Seminavis robusta]|uniref:Nitrilase family, member 2 n=1 Tax=Seminavis robusta TaxID=568900 RepID=A0A9N8DQ14_9STRA|nr:Nitrilase family, member 2 [Seminavis robusta]|eukprot:Sro270_g104330.1 Nitrilase family, member 2 (201) ;mRNA; r:64919-65753